jgi:hypothetical protein
MARTFIVRYRNLDSGYPLYQGGPGLNVNTGVRDRHTSVCRADNAERFTLDAAKRHARTCNDRWAGEVLDAAGEIVWQTRRMRASRFAADRAPV